jgi:glycerophosphoryl diester phosphodiesterase
MGQDPIVIAHRGASGYLPEHTLEAYQKAIDMGADFIEPDLVMTKDSILVVRHEPMLSGTTNVADIETFVSRKRRRIVDGQTMEDWFVCDFSLAELKQLKAIQAFPDRPQEFNALFTIPTFSEVIKLIKIASKKQNRIIGIYPETKHPSFHKNLGLDISQKLLEVLESENWNHRDSPVYIQSFEVSNLQYIRCSSSVKTIQLLSCSEISKNGELIFETLPGSMISQGKPYDWHVLEDSRDYSYFISDDGLEFIKTYADGIGVWKPFVFVKDESKLEPKPTKLVQRAHEKNLLVHVYTFRSETEKDYRTYYNLGVDGVFTDFTDIAVKAMLE